MLYRTSTQATLTALAVVAATMTLAPRPAAAQATCASLASASGLTGHPAIKSASSAIQPASGPNVAYCRVAFLYGTKPEQNINIAVGLPLSVADGGSGRLQGAWNGRTQGIGGGGCAGSLNVNGPVNAGYVGSGTDTGHTGGSCEPGVNADGTYNFQFIQDFIRNAIKQQVIWSKKIARSYYGMSAAYNYWNGCSTGGRQGYLLAQELGRELDGILANAPAIYWTRFQTAQMWGQIVMKDLVGGPIATAKLNQASTSAVAACDAADGVTDGIIDDPRTCTFSAKSNICGAPNAPPANCLTPAEADAIDKIWDGPRNSKGRKIWFGLDRGTSLGALNGTNPFPLGVTQFHWNEKDPNFDWRTVTIGTYPDVAQDGSRNIADVTDTFAPLDEFKQHGGKLLTFVGANDPLIHPRGVINYYREMAVRYDRNGRHSGGHGRDDGRDNDRHGNDDRHGSNNGHGNDRPDFDNLQKFYRLFRAPGVAHCGGGAGASPVDAFGALVNWVENKVPPPSLLAAGGIGAPAGRTRLLCPYPQTAIYNGSGDINSASSFRCGGDLEKKQVVCNDVLVRYKHEEHGSLDFSGTGLNPSACHAGRHADNDDRGGGHGRR
jgi:hypothetical protein